MNSDGVERKLQYPPHARRGHLPLGAGSAVATAACRVQLRMPSYPAVRDNWEGSADEWQCSLERMRHTAASVRDKCARELRRRNQNQQQWQLQGEQGQSLRREQGEAWDTLALRRAANASLESQVAHFVGCMQAWGGPSPRVARD